MIAAGRTPGVLGRIHDGEDVGTLIPPRDRPQKGRRGWLLHASRPRGRLVVDAGAEAALRQQGRSLLPSGIVAVEGRFREGDVVAIVGPDGAEFAYGLAVYGAEAVEKIRGLRSGEIARRLGFRTLEVVVHRDDLALLEGSASR